MAEIEFYGVRGSLPSPLSPAAVKDKVRNLLQLLTPEDLESEESMDRFIDQKYPIQSGTVGGNSSCLQLRYENAPVIICDSGSGLRELGLKLMQNPAEAKDIYIFQSHTHWDHIMGFPFFIPAYVPMFNIKVLGCHSDMEGRFHYQQQLSHFPVMIEQMSANIEFVQLKPDEPYQIGDLKVTPWFQDHPGDSYAYIFEDGQSKIIYSTDAAYNFIRDLKKGENLFTNADVLIFDAMYSFTDYMDKLDWGHCSSFVGVDFCINENIKNLILFHHEPTYDDATLADLLDKTVKYAERLYPKNDLTIELAVEGRTMKY